MPQNRDGYDHLCSLLATLLPPTVGRVHLRIGVEVPDALDVDNHQLVARSGGEEEAVRSQHSFHMSESYVRYWIWVMYIP